MYSGITTEGASWSPAVPIGSVYSGITTEGASWSPAVPIGSVYSGMVTTGAGSSPLLVRIFSSTGAVSSLGKTVTTGLVVVVSLMA